VAYREDNIRYDSCLLDPQQELLVAYREDNVRSDSCLLDFNKAS
jgi:hypothetical protein